MTQIFKGPTIPPETWEALEEAEKTPAKGPALASGTIQRARIAQIIKKAGKVGATGRGLETGDTGPRWRS